MFDPEKERLADLERHHRRQREGDFTAFPSSEEQTQGMLFRQYVAAQALAGVLASYSGDVLLPKPDVAAEKAVEYADALLARLAANAAEGGTDA